MRYIAILVGFLLASCASHVAQIENNVSGTIVITQDNGGPVGEYIQKISAAKKRGDRVEIIGQCLSACTLWLSMPQDQICVGNNAVLGFHDATSPIPIVSDAMRDSMRGVLMSYYPASIKSWLLEQGGLASQLKFLDGERLHSMFKSCEV